MRLDINLATAPYQDVARFLRRWGLVAAVLLLCTVALVWYAVSSWRNTHEVNRQIAQMQTEIRQAHQERAAALEMLRRPENRDIADQSHFLNDLILRKSFSWTRVFMTLEKIMPPHLHVNAIQPEMASSRQLQLRMTVAGNSRDQAEELVKRLETSPTFQNAQLRSETMIDDPKQGDDRIAFEISADYIPLAVPATADPAAAKVTKATKPVKPVSAGRAVR